MAWMIVSDSSCEIRELENPAPGVQFALVPFKIRVGEREYVDLATLNTQQMLQAMTDYNGASTTACPSPEEWAEYFLQADNVFAFTISSNLSGSYNAAHTAASACQGVSRAYHGSAAAGAETAGGGATSDSSPNSCTVSAAAASWVFCGRASTAN